MNDSNSKSDFWLKRKLRYYLVARKFKNLRIDKEKLWINSFIVLAFGSILIGLAILLGFLFKLSSNYTILENNIDLDKTGQVGSFVGGVIGTIWTLTGILLFYAALRLQSKELKENRIHFQLSRLNEIVYKQIDIFNNQLQDFEIKDIEKNKRGKLKKYKGRSAISVMKQRVEAINDIRDEIDSGKVFDARKIFLTDHIAFIEVNKKMFLNIYSELSNHIDTIRAILIKEDIPPSDLNELKGIFFRNIGKDFLNSTELMLPFFQLYIDMQKKFEAGYDELWSIEGSIINKIKVIIEFRNVVYDKNTIKNYLSNRDMYNMHKL